MYSEDLGHISLKKNTTLSLRTNYQKSDDYERLSSEKKIQRKKILDFLLSNKDKIRYNGFLGFPGKFWMMERELLRINPELKIASIESNPLIYHKTKTIMPGGHKIISKSKDIYSGFKLDIHVNKNCGYLLGRFDQLTDNETHELLSVESGTYSHFFNNNNMIWLDFTSSLNEQTYKSIHNIKNVCNKDKTAICITILYGRDQYFNGSGEEARIEIIKKALPDFTCMDYWKYKGFNGSTMFNVCGILEARHE